LAKMARWRFFLAAALWLFACQAARAVEPVFVPVAYRGHRIQLRGLFDKPPGAGPFPAVILLHDCTGWRRSLPRSTFWSDILVAEGYATLMIDSFSARGYLQVCAAPDTVPISERVLDVYAAGLMLAKRPDIRADKIAVMGFAHGGSAALHAAAMAADWRSAPPNGSLAMVAANQHGTDYVNALQQQFTAAAAALTASHGKIVAYVAFYPGSCSADRGDHFAGPILLLIGNADPYYSECIDLAAVRPIGGPEFLFKAYPNAGRDFDYALGQNSRDLPENRPASAASQADVKDFLRRYLR
jgi:dienelactone hydrolase